MYAIPALPDPDQQARADQYSKEMEAVASWHPDYFNVRSPSDEDIDKLVDASGLKSNPNLGEHHDDVIHWFAHSLI